MKKRILYTIPNFDTAGSGKALLNIAKGLDPGQFEPHIACMHDKGDFFRVVQVSGIPVHILPFVSPARPVSRLIKSAWSVSRQFKRINPDLIHSFHYNADYTEALAARLAGIPWVFTKKNMSWGGASANAWKLRSFLAKGIAVQNTDMQRQFYPNSTKTILIPRGVDTNAFAPQPPDPIIRAQMQTHPDKRIIICVANMVPVKGIELLIEAFAQLAQQFPEWVLWLVGEDQNEYGQKLRQVVAKREMHEVIRFAGKQSGVRTYLDQAEIFVLPTKNKGEGSPVAVLEAMANKKLSIGSAVPGIKDQLNKWSECLFEPDNSFNIKCVLNNFMLNTPKQNYAIAETQFQYVNGKFRIQTEVEGHQKFYTNVLKA